MRKIFFGTDLSCPVNISDTVISWFQYNHKNNEFLLIDFKIGADDKYIFDVIKYFSEKNSVFIDLDAHLSYNIKGGDRKI